MGIWTVLKISLRANIFSKVNIMVNTLSHELPWLADLYLSRANSNTLPLTSPIE